MNDMLALNLGAADPDDIAARGVERQMIKEPVVPSREALAEDHSFGGYPQRLNCNRARRIDVDRLIAVDVGDKKHSEGIKIMMGRVEIRCCVQSCGRFELTDSIRSENANGVDRRKAERANPIRRLFAFWIDPSRLIQILFLLIAEDLQRGCNVPERFVGGLFDAVVEVLCDGIELVPSPACCTA